jgi:hypothetical protein
MTAKYSAAVKAALMNSVPVSSDQEELYQILQDNWVFWDSKTKDWTKSKEKPAKPSELVHVRVWASADQVDMIAEKLITDVYPRLEMVEKSPVYLCRPPKQLEGRVYLSFKRGS